MFPYKGKEVDDNLLNNTELGATLAWMRQQKGPGLSGIWVDHLKEWYTDTYPDRNDVKPDPECVRCWALFAEIDRKCFKSGTPPLAFLYGMLVIITKDDKGGVCGIGLLEAIHKLILAVINLRILTSVEFCAAVHGFWRQRGCFTAIGKTKLRMQRATCTVTTIYQVFLDLWKA